MMNIQVSSALGLTIMGANSSHLDSILRIEEEAFSSPWSRKMFEAELHGNPFSRIVVARPFPESANREDIIGYCCYWLVFEELRLLNLAVKPSWRRKGVASQLIHYVLHEGQTEGIEQALLEVRESNVAARNLYKSFGFWEYGKRPSYYSNPEEDAVLMKYHGNSGDHMKPRFVR